MWETWVQSLGRENPLEKEMATHSSILAWRIPWMEEPDGLQPMGSQSRTRLSDFAFTFHLHALEKEMTTHSSVPAWRIPGTGEPGGLPSMGSHRVRHDWSDLASISLYGYTTVYLSTPLLRDILLASNLWKSQRMLLKHSHAGFWGEIIFQLI